ncbi:MAG TPA: hypothetical protein GX513_03380 [Firmicutes bacterium]|nr:hypothetical protein [Bacillota bacterium]
MKVIKSLLNRDALDILVTYLKLAPRRQVLHDLAWPLLLSTVLVLLVPVVCQKSMSYDPMQALMSLTELIVTVLSILAGFNIAAVSILSTSSSALIDELRSSPLDGRPGTQLHQLVCYFFWAILVQLGGLTVALLLYVAGKFTPINTGCAQLFMGVIFLFTTYSTSLTIRSVSILYLFILAKNSSR